LNPILGRTNSSGKSQEDTRDDRQDERKNDFERGHERTGMAALVGDRDQANRNPDQEPRHQRDKKPLQRFHDAVTSRIGQSCSVNGNLNELGKRRPKRREMGELGRLRLNHLEILEIEPGPDGASHETKLTTRPRCLPASRRNDPGRMRT
jgi:hypothetical protein